jgi:predicted O-methyltransferase YrrM
MGDRLERLAVNAVCRLLDVLLTPLTLLSGLWFRAVREIGVRGFPLSRAIFSAVGVFPIIDHYYEPLFRTADVAKELDTTRPLPGIDFNSEEQLALLRQFRYGEELLSIPSRKPAVLEYGYDDGPFLAGDADYLYSMIRLFKPQTMIEVGAGQSTLLSEKAIRENGRESKGYACRHICIEPYAPPWMSELGVEIIAEAVEKVDVGLFQSLRANDILFIDSSHMIRPRGDVQFLYLTVLPMLEPGVLIHVHDVFTPMDYPKDWIAEDLVFWNEQYLVEAFLTLNGKYKIIGALNYLKHHHPREARQYLPMLSRQFDSREPGSLWMMRCAD